MGHILKNLNITKHSGELELFDIEKFRMGLHKSGVKDDLINSILYDLSKEVYEGISSKKIYQIAYRLLKRNSKSTAGRFRLKKSLLELGPSGYPFEKLMGRLFEHKGYQTQVGVLLDGKHIVHEVDVWGENSDEVILVECKFHHQQGRKSDVKVPLYIHSRFEDIKDVFQRENKYIGKKITGYIVTNTRFTEDAQSYGDGEGLQLVSWGVGGKNNLQKWIEEAGFHIITALSTATKRQKKELIEHNIILCRDLVNCVEMPPFKEITRKQFKKMKAEAQDILIG